MWPRSEGQSAVNGSMWPPDYTHFKASQAHPLPTVQLMQLHPHICRGLPLPPSPPQITALFVSDNVCRLEGVCTGVCVCEVESGTGRSHVHNSWLINHGAVLMAPCCFPNVFWQRQSAAGTELMQAHIWLHQVNDRTPFMYATLHAGCHQPHTTATG